MLLILVIVSATHFGVTFPYYDPFYFLKESSATQPMVPKYTYLVRIINPEQRSRFVTKIWHHVRERFNSPDLLKLRLIETFEDKLPPLSELELGYLEKKTNAKRWIEDRDDLEALYQAFSSGDEITLWCDARHAPEEQKKRKKRKTEETDETPIKKRASKEDQVEKLILQLREKHNDQFSGSQLRLWARMKINGQHESLDAPPNIPIFTGSTPNPKATRSDSLSDALTSAATAVVGLLKDSGKGAIANTTLSPAKREHVCGQYLDYLEKLKKLYKSDA